MQHCVQNKVLWAAKTARRLMVRLVGFSLNSLCLMSILALPVPISKVLPSVAGEHLNRARVAAARPVVSASLVYPRKAPSLGSLEAKHD